MNRVTRRNHEMYRPRLSGRCTRMRYIGSIQKLLRRRDLHSGKSDPTLIVLHDSVPADCLENVVDTKNEEILYQKVSLSQRPSPKVVLMDAWQVQREDYHQLGTSTVGPLADEGMTEPNIDFGIQGIPPAAVEQDEDDRTR